MLKIINKFLVTFVIFANIYAPDNTQASQVEQLKNAIKQSNRQKVENILTPSKATAATQSGGVVSSIVQTLEQDAISEVEQLAEQEVTQALGGTSSTANMSRGQKVIAGLVSLGLGLYKLGSDITTGSYSSDNTSNTNQNDFTNASVTLGLLLYGVRDLYQAYTNTDGTQKTNSAIATKTILSQVIGAQKMVAMPGESV